MFCLILSVIVPVLTAVVFAIDAACRAALQSLVNADGSPSIAESVTRDQLTLSKICADLCLQVYGRVEDLRIPGIGFLRIPGIGFQGFRVDRVLVSEDLSAVCVVLNTDDTCIVVWRGTNPTNRRQVRANTACDLVPFPPPIERFSRPHAGLSRAHAGLVEQYNKAGDVMAVMAVIRQQVLCGRHVILTGHSQGGGLAAVTASHMISLGLPVGGLITFGSMRPGNAELAAVLTHHVPLILRYHNHNDLVPLLPPFSRGYAHAGDTLYIWPAGMVTRSPGRLLRFVQRCRSWLTGVIGDGLHDHAMAEYQAKLHAVRVC